MSELYIGVMSGTSLDGIDVVACDIDKESCRLIHSYEYSFDKELKREILNAIDTLIPIKKIGEIDTRLGEAYAYALEDFLERFNIPSKKVKAIGLHGQTLWHEPNSKYPFSMQLANASIITARIGICVVCDFRQKDIALGGQGAPFAPAFHRFLFSKLERSAAVLNIGGIANLTILGDKEAGYDTGCGNTLLDSWIMQCRGEAYDKDGDFAKSGKVDTELLEKMLNDEYFKRTPPKSTGREYFNMSWLASYLPVFQTLKDEDVQATLLELSAKSIADEVKKASVDILIVCGGGVKNIYLMKRLQEMLPSIEVIPSDKLNVSSEFMEAMAFAWLAYKRIHKETVKLSHITGASRDSILGCIYE